MAKATTEASVRRRLDREFEPMGIGADCWRVGIGPFRQLYFSAPDEDDPGETLPPGSYALEWLTHNIDITADLLNPDALEEVARVMREFKRHMDALGYECSLELLDEPFILAQKVVQLSSILKEVRSMRRQFAAFQCKCLYTEEDDEEAKVREEFEKKFPNFKEQLFEKIAHSEAQ